MATIVSKLDVQCRLYKELLVKALGRFYNEDAKDLFDGNPIDERAMVGCIARYVWCDRKRDKYKELMPHVDVEYNKKHTPNDGAWVKAFELVSGCKGACRKSRYKYCGNLIQSRINDRCRYSSSCCAVDCSKHLYRFRPDLIIHKRGSGGDMGDGNGMIVEFKKDGANDGDIAFDCAKIRYCTCGCSEFRYRIGAFVLLKCDSAEVQLFVDGRKAGRRLRVNGSICKKGINQDHRSCLP